MACVSFNTGSKRLGGRTFVRWYTQQSGSTGRTLVYSLLYNGTTRTRQRQCLFSASSLQITSLHISGYEIIEYFLRKIAGEKISAYCRNTPKQFSPSVHHVMWFAWKFLCIGVVEIVGSWAVNIPHVFPRLSQAVEENSMPCQAAGKSDRKMMPAVLCSDHYLN